MRYCFDLDDTICIHKNRDYPNAAPIDEVIAKMKELRRVDPESHIIINTSRGMNSCKGDSRLAEERNRAVIEEWLFKHGVPYDEIVFGKPLADAYIDDKAVPAHRFSSGCVREYKGFSGASVIRVADMVIKGGEKTAFEYDWYSKDRALKFKRHKTPNVFTQTLGKLCLEYVSGTPLYDVVSSSVAGETYIARVRDVLSEFSQCREGGENDVGAYCDFIRERGDAVGVETSSIREKLLDDENIVEKTFNHGDLTMQNIIVKGNELFLIDPSKSPISTWLLDASKFRASLNGLDSVLTGRVSGTRRFIPFFDSLFDGYGGTIRVLEKTHYIRVMFYAKKLGKQDVFEQLKRMVEE